LPTTENELRILNQTNTPHQKVTFIAAKSLHPRSIAYFEVNTSQILQNAQNTFNLQQRKKILESDTVLRSPLEGTNIGAGKR